MPRRILVVDCDPHSSAATEQLLHSAGYQSTAAFSFEEGIRAVAAHRPDLLITDVRLGRFNGLHLALRSRGDHPTLPVVVLGEEGDAALASEAKRLGAEFLPKSAASRDLLRVVTTLLTDASHT